ncbi:MAG: DUF1543 domain-containing protein [Bacteroidota bacterium]
MPKLFMLLVGCSPKGRRIEQHDIFFGIGETIKDLIPAVISSWPETEGKLHFDAWREVRQANGYTVTIVPKNENSGNSEAKLFFINLGGYKQNEFEEFHYKMIIAAHHKGEAVSQSKETAFYRHTGFAGATSHIDDKYGIDVDDVFEIEDILDEETKRNFNIVLVANETPQPEDEIHLGYFKLSSFQ